MTSQKRRFVPCGTIFFSSLVKKYSSRPGGVTVTAIEGMEHIQTHSIRTCSRCTRRQYVTVTVTVTGDLFYQRLLKERQNVNITSTFDMASMRSMRSMRWGFYLGPLQKEYRDADTHARPRLPPGPHWAASMGELPCDKTQGSAAVWHHHGCSCQAA
jgi:hypothetical protein